MPLTTARPWLIAVLLGLLTLSPAHAGMTPEEVKAFEGAKAKAEKGDAQAQFWLGVSYAEGKGVAKDQVQAVSWWRKAAVQGYDNAQMSLGVCYANGTGVAKDQVQAVKWTRKGAEQGDVGCLEAMGVYYANGLGVTKNLIEAYAYLSLAGITYEHARELLTAHEKKMSAVQIAAGKKRAIVLQKEIDAKEAAKKAEDEKKAGK